MNVEERCQCGFTMINILEPKFLCFAESEDAVTYRAKIIGTGVDSPTDIAILIQNWIAPGPRVDFGIVLIAVDGSCPTEMSQTSVVGGALGGVLVLILIVLRVIIALIVYCWIHKKRSGKLEITKDRYIDKSLLHTDCYTLSAEGE